MTTLFKGKAPARPGAVSFQFSQFANTSVLATPPKTFGHEALVSEWGMQGNDKAGDCVFAGAAHEIMLWNAEVGKTVDISTDTTLGNYARCTGYNSKTGENDNGTDVAAWLQTRRKTGFLDDHGYSHKVGAYVALEPGNVEQLFYAAYYFDGVGIGVNFPDQWMKIFDQGGRVWPSLKHPNYDGGHYVSNVAWRDGKPVIVTWGQKVELTPAAYSQTCDEAYAYLTPEKLAKGVDLQGFDYQKLSTMITQLRRIR